MSHCYYQFCVLEPTDAGQDGQRVAQGTVCGGDCTASLLPAVCDSSEQ